MYKWLTLYLVLFSDWENRNNFDFVNTFFYSYFNIPKHQLPTIIQNHIKEARCDSVRKNRKNNDQSRSDFSKATTPKHTEPFEIRYYSLNLNRTNVLLVDDRAQFNRMLAYLIHQPMVAFDAEWKPIGSSSSSSVALIQFATSERVYLLDAVTIDIELDTWNRLAIEIFNNCEILKIGE